MQTSLTSTLKRLRYFSIAEWLVVGVMASVILGFVISLVRVNGSVYRTNIAVEIANHLQHARIDSMHRAANDINQMARVTILDRRSYSIAIDGNNDGYVDPPMIVSLPQEPNVEFDGPFPKSYIFDGQGKTLDAQSRNITPQPMTVGDESGASAIEFSDDGKITVVPTSKLTAAR